MKIECEQCAARYSIADAKIKSSTFKVRCKQCQSYIVVRDAGAELGHPNAPAPLTGQRNQDSVLFSLEDIAPPAAAAQARAPLRLVPPPAEDSTGSGLLDIREMQAKLATERTLAPELDEPEALSMPSFGGAGLGGLSAAPLLSPPPPAPAPQPQAPRRGLLYALLTTLSLGVLGLGAYVALLDPEPTTVTVLEAAQVEREPEATLAAAALAEPQTEEPTQEDGEASSSSAAPEAQTSAVVKPKRNGNRNRNRDRGKVTTSQPKQPKQPSPGKQEPKSDEVDIDCLLDKTLPKCGGKGTPKPKPSPKPSPAPIDDNLPSKLGVTQINKGISPIKTAARACGSGTTVAVKFSVEGSSGRVLSAKPLDEHATSAVGACVAKAAKGASFPRFASKQQGFTFKFRL